MATKKVTPTAAATALEAFQARFAKRHGELAMRQASEGVRKYDVISTGSLALDFAMGCGGYIRGRITESWGPESVGKTTMSLLGAASAQRTVSDRMVGFIDMEHSLDLDWAEKLGVDMSRLLVVQPDNAESLADVVKDLVSDRQGINGKAGDYWFSQIVIDSVGNITAQEEFEKDAAAVVVGTNAKIITRMVRVNSVLAHRANTSLHVINQVRANIGAYGGGNTTGGGFALKHASTHKLKYAKSGDGALTMGTDEAKVQFGMGVAVTVEKNKVAPPRRVANLILINTPLADYGNIVGVDQVPEAATLGIATGVIVQAGAWYTLPNGSRHQGKKGVLAELRADRSLVAAVREQALLTLTDVANDTGPEPVIDLDDMAEETA
jgi:recombination protein RecA